MNSEIKNINNKEARKQAVLNSTSYRIIDTTARFLDRYFIDPILGLIFPGLADLLTSILVLPFVYYSLFILRSIPLTLAIIANTLKDVVIGMIPFFIGDILDVFKKSYIENLDLINGYINDDKKIISEINRKAILSGIVIIVLCIIIYYIFKFVLWSTGEIIDIFMNFWQQL